MSIQIDVQATLRIGGATVTAGRYSAEENITAEGMAEWFKGATDDIWKLFQPGVFDAEMEERP